MVDKEPRRVSRREFLKLLRLGAVGLVFGCTARPAPAAEISSPTPRPSEPPTPTPFPPTLEPALPPESTAAALKPAPTETTLPRVISKDTAVFETLPPEEIAKLQQEDLAQGKVRLPLPEKLLNEGVRFVIENYEYRVGGLPQQGTRLKLYAPPDKAITIPSFTEGVIDGVSPAERDPNRPGGIIAIPVFMPDGRKFYMDYSFPAGSEIHVKEKDPVKVGDVLATVTYRPESPEQARFRAKRVGDDPVLVIGVPRGSELLESISGILAFSTP